MRDLYHDFKNPCQRKGDGSLATQPDRESILNLIANQLDENGFRHPRAPGVRAKRASALRRADGLEGAGGGRANGQAVEPGPEAVQADFEA